MNQRDNAACLESLQRFVDQAMVPLALEGFQSMYKQGEEIRLSQSAENLTNAGIMLQLLDEVRTWTQVLLDEEVRRIEARIPYLQKLLTALFVMKVKVLSCINMRKVTTEFPLTIPSSHTFVHNMYIHAARALADNISIVDDMRMSNMRELISDALRRAEFDCLRWDELLTWGLDGVDPSDALRDMLTSTPADVDTDERPASFEPPRSTTVDNVDDEDSEFRTIANEDKADPPEHADDAADDGPMSSDDFPPLNASDSEHDDTRNVSTAEPAQNDADANADDSTAEPTQKAFCPKASRMPRVYGAVKGNRLILQGHPNADMVMEVENDEWTLRHGKCILMKVAADGDEVLSDTYVESVLEIVKQSVFHNAATFRDDVKIIGKLTVDGPIEAFKNLRRVTDTTGLLRLYVNPATGDANADSKVVRTVTDLAERTGGVERAVAEASKRAEAVEMRAEAADKRAEAADKRAEAAGKRAEAVEKRAEAAEKRADAAEKRADTAHERTAASEKAVAEAGKRADAADKAAMEAKKLAEDTRKRVDDLKKRFEEIEKKMPK